MDRFEKQPMLVLLVGVLGISLSAIFVKYSSAPPAVTAAYRLLWTVLLMSPTVLGKKEVRRELLTADKKTVATSVISGVLLAVHFYTWFESLNRTSVASSTIIVSTEALWVALGFFVFLKGKLNGREILAIIISFVGSVLIALADSSAGGNHLSGDIWALIAALAVGAYTLLGRVVRTNNTSTAVYTYICYSASALSLVLLASFQGNSLFAFGWSGVIAGLLLAIFSTILGHSIFSWCLKYLSPAFVSASKLCEPVISSLIAAFLFAEIPSFLQVIGSLVVLAGVIYYSLVELAEDR